MLKPKDVVNQLTSMLNNICSENDEKEFVEALMCEHRTLQQKTARLFLQCMVEWAGAAEKQMFDDRNKKTVEVAKSIVHLLEDEDVLIKGRVYLPYI
jgi:hypothetical protein